MNYAELSALCHEKGAQHIGGWLWGPDCEWLSDFLTTKIKPEEQLQVAEIGVFQGGGSLIFLTALPNCKFYAIDDWKGGPASPGYPTIKEGFIDCTKIFADRIELVSGDSIETGKNWKQPLDICLVDGCHDGEYPRHDIMNFGKWVKKGGYLFVDDWTMGPPRHYIEQLLMNNSKWKLIKHADEHKGDMMGFQKLEEGDVI